MEWVKVVGGCFVVLFGVIDWLYVVVCDIDLLFLFGVVIFFELMCGLENGLDMFKFFLVV